MKAVHELSITEAILATVLDHAKRLAAERVHRILLVVSEFSDLQPLWLQRYFNQLAKGSVAADARLEIESMAPEFVCNGCGASFFLSLRGLDTVACTVCGNRDCTLVKKADYVVEEIEVS
jgi:hydrogenase nickel incorporation protein HypA/HybF